MSALEPTTNLTTTTPILPEQRRSAGCFSYPYPCTPPPPAQRCTLVGAVRVSVFMVSVAGVASGQDDLSLTDHGGVEQEYHVPMSTTRPLDLSRSILSSSPTSGEPRRKATSSAPVRTSSADVVAITASRTLSGSSPPRWNSAGDGVHQSGIARADGALDAVGLCGACSGLVPNDACLRFFVSRLVDHSSLSTRNVIGLHSACESRSSGTNDERWLWDCVVLVSVHFGQLLNFGCGGGCPLSHELGKLHYTHILRRHVGENANREADQQSHTCRTAENSDLRYRYQR